MSLTSTVPALDGGSPARFKPMYAPAAPCQCGVFISVNHPQPVAHHFNALGFFSRIPSPPSRVSPGSRKTTPAFSNACWIFASVLERGSVDEPTNTLVSVPASCPSARWSRPCSARASAPRSSRYGAEGGDGR